MQSLAWGNSDEITRPKIVMVRSSVPTNNVEASDSNGASETLAKLHVQLRALQDATSSTAALDRWNIALEILDDIERECPEIQKSCIDVARAFIAAIPRSVAAPDVMELPTGGIGFEWRKGSDKILTISVYDDARLVFALIEKGIRQEHGTEIFRGQLPRRLLASLHANFSANEKSKRSA